MAQDVATSIRGHAHSPATRGTLRSAPAANVGLGPLPTLIGHSGVRDLGPWRDLLRSNLNSCNELIKINGSSMGFHSCRDAVFLFVSGIWQAQAATVKRLRLRIGGFNCRSVNHEKDSSCDLRIRLGVSGSR